MSKMRPIALTLMNYLLEGDKLGAHLILYLEFFKCNNKVDILILKNP